MTRLARTIKTRPVAWVFLIAGLLLAGTASFFVLADNAERFLLTDSQGRIVASFDGEGNLKIRGDITSNTLSAITANAGKTEWYVQNVATDIVTLIEVDDQTVFPNTSIALGNLITSGTITTSQTLPLSVPGDALFVIKNDSNQAVAYIDGDGNIKLTGLAYENQNFAFWTTLIARAGIEKIQLDWTPSADQNHSYYKIYRSLSPTSGYTLLTTTSGITYTNSGLTADTPYYYYVTDVDTSANESDPSNLATATPFGDCKGIYPANWF